MAGTSQNRRVVVTGMGAVTPIGQFADDFWSNIRKGVCGTERLEFVGASHKFVQPAARISDFNSTTRLKHWRRDKTIHVADRYSWLGAAAADEAIHQAGLEVPFVNANRAACIIGSAAGGQNSGEKGSRDRFIDHKPAVHPMFLPRVIGSSAAAHVGIEFGAQGATFGICSAATSAAHAISMGRDLIRWNQCDVAIVGGTESALTYGVMLASKSLGLLSSEGCFPFASKRSGTIFAEGAGVMVLEAEAHAVARGASIKAEVCGVGMTSSGEDMLVLHAEPAREAMRMSLQDAGCDPTDIDYINLDGSACRANDINESKAVREVFGGHCEDLPASSTKAMHGHALGASPAIEAIVCLKAMSENWVPPTIGLDEPDAECDLDYLPNEGRARTVRYAMSNSFSVGGFYTSIVFAKVGG
jgi:nodulation protein E